MSRQRAFQVALTLLASLALAILPPKVGAQDVPHHVNRAVGLVMETLVASAQTASRAFSGVLPAAVQGAHEADDAHGTSRTGRALSAVSGVAVIGFILALVVLVSAQQPLEAVARAAERDISKSFWVGLLWQALAVPLLLTLSILLAVTIILIPAIPIAMLAWALAYAGALSLGLFAVALVLGRSVLGRSTSHDRRALLSSLMCGMIILTAVWLGAAAAVNVPVAGILARLVALALTWAAATIGLGAVVRSRAGTVPREVEITTETAVPAWQTPTPVFGVVAARRPTPVSSTTPE